jgi:hypothetical protein
MTFPTPVIIIEICPSKLNSRPTASVSGGQGAGVEKSLEAEKT